MKGAIAIILIFIFNACSSDSLSLENNIRAFLLTHSGKENYGISDPGKVKIIDSLHLDIINITAYKIDYANERKSSNIKFDNNELLHDATVLYDYSSNKFFLMDGIPFYEDAKLSEGIIEKSIYGYLGDVMKYNSDLNELNSFINQSPNFVKSDHKFQLLDSLLKFHITYFKAVDPYKPRKIQSKEDFDDYVNFTMKGMQWNENNGLHIDKNTFYHQLGYFVSRRKSTNAAIYRIFDRSLLMFELINIKKSTEPGYLIIKLIITPSPQLEVINQVDSLVVK